MTTIKDKFWKILKNNQSTDKTTLLKELRVLLTSYDIKLNFVIVQEGNSFVVSLSDTTSLYVLKGILSD